MVYDSGLHAHYWWSYINRTVFLVKYSGCVVYDSGLHAHYWWSDINRIAFGIYFGCVVYDSGLHAHYWWSYTNKIAFESVHPRVVSDRILAAGAVFVSRVLLFCLIFEYFVINFDFYRRI